MSVVFPKAPDLNLQYSPIKKLVVDLNHANILALSGSAIPLITSQVPLIPVLIVLYPFIGTAYTGVDAAARILITDSSGDWLTTTVADDSGGGWTQVTDLLAGTAIITLNTSLNYITDEIIGNPLTLATPYGIWINLINHASTLAGGIAGNKLRVMVYYVELDV